MHIHIYVHYMSSSYLCMRAASIPTPRAHTQHAYQYSAARTYLGSKKKKKGGGGQAFKHNHEKQIGVHAHTSAHTQTHLILSSAVWAVRAMSGRTSKRSLRAAPAPSAMASRAATACPTTSRCVLHTLPHICKDTHVYGYIYE